MLGTNRKTTPNLSRALWYVASDIKVVHTGLAVPKGHVDWEKVYLYLFVL